MSLILTVTRRTLFVTWLALVGAVLALVLLTHVSAPLGYRIVIIRGSSMTPAIPLGALAFEQPVAGGAIEAGDVVTMSLPQGAMVTHRVTRTATIDGQRYIETRGDANAQVDATLQPAGSVTGVVRFHVPIVGFLLAFLGIPTGIISVISMLGSLIAVVWLLEEVEADEREPETAPETPELVRRGAVA